MHTPPEPKQPSQAPLIESGSTLLSPAVVLLFLIRRLQRFDPSSQAAEPSSYVLVIVVPRHTYFTWRSGPSQGVRIVAGVSDWDHRGQIRTERYIVAAETKRMLVGGVVWQRDRRRSCDWGAQPRRLTAYRFTGTKRLRMRNNDQQRIYTGI